MFPGPESAKLRRGSVQGLPREYSRSRGRHAGAADLGEVSPRFKGKPNFVFAVPCPHCGYEIEPRETDAPVIAHHQVPEVRRSVRRDGWPRTHQHILIAVLRDAHHALEPIPRKAPAIGTHRYCRLSPLSRWMPARTGKFVRL
jgi:hypothetical protein